MNYALFVEYEGILLGNTQKFSQLSLTRLREKTTAKQILRFIFEELLEWTPEQVRDYLTPQIAEKLHLTRIVHQIDFPSECNPETDLFYLAAFVYPKRIRISKRKQVLFVYEKVLQGKLKKFPKNFFLSGDAEYNLEICLAYALNHFGNFHSVEELYGFFADKRKFCHFAKEHKLIEPIRNLYENPVELLHNTLPSEMQNDFFYEYYSYQYSLNSGT